MKVGIIGVRDLDGELYTNRQYIDRALRNFLDRNNLHVSQLHVLTGGGKGVEQIVVDWCDDNTVTYRKIPPNISKYGGKQAFIQRNNEIIGRADTTIIFWDGYMDVTQEAIAYATQRGIETHVVPIV